MAPVPLPDWFCPAACYYGTTQYGDSGSGLDDGTVFRVPVTGGSSSTNLYSFAGPDGSQPFTELILSGGTLYGTTSIGGTGSDFGTLFKIDTSGSNFSTVCNFNGNDGWAPVGGLLLSGGMLYGTTGLGGILPTVFAFANGVVFSIPMNGFTPTDLCVFSGADGAISPQTGLALSGNILFGTTVNGGTNNTGALFEIGTNGGDYANVYDFSAENSGGENPDGANPRGVLVLSGGMFYGTTRYGGTNGAGSVFKMNADGTGFTNIYSFSDAYPESPVTALAVSGSTIYGAGGAGSFGSLYKLNTDGSGFTNFYSFNGTDGNGPGGLTLSGGVLYGATGSGGAGYGELVPDEHRWQPLHQYLQLHRGQRRRESGHGFGFVEQCPVRDGVIMAAPTAREPRSRSTPTGVASPCSMPSWARTATAQVRATCCCPAGRFMERRRMVAVWTLAPCTSMDTSGNNFTVLKNFTGGSDGANCDLTLVLLSNVLYGTTQNGGLSGYGTVFSLTVPPPSFNPNTFQITAITKQGNNVLVTWQMGAGPTNALQAAPGGSHGSYTTNGFTDIFHRDEYVISLFGHGSNGRVLS